MVDTSTTPSRKVDTEAMLSLIDWLGERPELPLPLEGAWAMPPDGERYGEDGRAFHVFAHSKAEVERFIAQFDEFEAAPQYLLNVGVRRRFGPVAYEILVGDNPWWGERVSRRPDPVRSARLAGLREMTAWLAERPTLAFPTLGANLIPGGAESGEDDEALFHVWASSPAEQDKMLAEFDRVDRDGLPGYVKPTLRSFAGGVVYGVGIRD